MSLNNMYANAVSAIKPNVNHARIADSERRYAVTVDGITTYTDSPSRVARLTHGGTVGRVIDRKA